MHTLFFSLALLGCDPDVGIDTSGTTHDSGLTDTEDTEDIEDTEDTEDTEDAEDTEDTAPTDCPRTAAAADRTRYVLAARPYGENGQQVATWEVFELSTNGVLSRPGKVFSLGRAFLGEMVFTPDGEVGLVAQDDGTVGVVTLSATGDPTVVHTDYNAGGAFYASAVTVSNDGTQAWIVDGNWPNNGGGLFRADIGCDGSLSNPTKIIEAKLAESVTIGRDGVTAFVATKELDGVEGTGWLFDLSTGTAITGSSVFPDDDWILGHGIWTPDGALALVADNSGFSTVPNRVGVFSVGSGTLTASQVVGPFTDPIQIVPSPHNDAILVVEGMGDAVKVLKRTGNANSPVSLTGEPTYVGTGPQLPSGATQVKVGGLMGTVLVGELHGIRIVTFDGTGGVTDGGLFVTGSTIDNSIGAIGVQP